MKQNSIYILFLKGGAALEEIFREPGSIVRIIITVNQV